MTTRVVTDEQLGNLARRQSDLFTRVAKGVVSFKTTMDGLQLILEGKNVEEVDNPCTAEIRQWQKFYKKVFGENMDFLNICIPEKPKGDWRLIIVAKGMSPERLFKKCCDMFPSWKYSNSNLDEIVISDRIAKDGHYVVWVRDSIEADEEFKNLSANKLKEQKHQGITFEERLLFELIYFWEFKKHLDIQNWTLCTGSRYADGLVPFVGWSVGEMYVFWLYSDGTFDYLRSRQAVS